MYKDDSEQGTAYDNPDGKPMKESTKYGEAGKVNMLALTWLRIRMNNLVRLQISM